MNITITPSIANGIITAPPSKSYTHRAIILASLARGTSSISNALISDDTNATIEACKSLGAKIQFDTKGNLIISGFDGKPKPTVTQIDCNASGTTFRFMTAIATLASEKIVLTGSSRLRQRPMKELTNTLNTLCKQKGGEITLSGNTSSQFISALLLITPYMKHVVTILLSDSARSKPYIDITIDMMEKFGITVTREGYKMFIVKPSSYKAATLEIEGDYSNASYFFAAAAITGGRVTVTGLNTNSQQGDRFFLEILKMMGCTVQIEKKEITVSEKAKHPVEIDMSNFPDIVQTVATISAVIPGKTVIKNIAHLREKETNRIDNTAKELGKFGIKTETMDDSLIIYGGTPIGAVIDTHNDHRMAMSMAVLGLGAVGKTIIKNSDVVAKSYPKFWDDLKRVTIHNS